MKNISAPFLATDIRQLTALSGVDIGCVEAIIFNREDLEDRPWQIIWSNISTACDTYNAENVIFHFSVNDSDYTDDPWVRIRLKEAYERVSDLGISGMVVHSNRIRPIPEWQRINLNTEREKVVTVLNDLLSLHSSQRPWLGLENMPVMDNHGIEIDPIFCFPHDFKILNGTNIGITWDICHYTNTLANMEKLYNGSHLPCHYPNSRIAQLEDFSMLENKIVHWHFSAFAGIANPDTGEKCHEGVLPEVSALGEETYISSAKLMKKMLKSDQKITLEIQEKNYVISRRNFEKMAAWLTAV